MNFSIERLFYNFFHPLPAQRGFAKGKEIIFHSERFSAIQRSTSERFHCSVNKIKKKSFSMEGLIFYFLRKSIKYFKNYFNIFPRS